jgi:hypothetical protein
MIHWLKVGEELGTIGVPFYTVSPRRGTCEYEAKRLHPSVKTCGVTLMEHHASVRSTSLLNAARISGVFLNGAVVYFRLHPAAVSGLLQLNSMQ